MTNYKETLMYREISETPAILSGLIEKNAGVMKNIAAEFKERKIKHITGAARGTSSHALIYFKYLAEIYSKATVSFAACSVLTVYGGKTDFSGQLVIGVSQSGKAADVLEVLKTANAQGALTLGITNNPESPIAKEAKYHLFCGCGEEKSVAATKTFSAQIFLLAWLAGEIAGNSDIINGLKGVGANLAKELPAIEKLTEDLSVKIAEAKDGFTLARGITYALALESALKLQETSYIKMKGYAFSDFQHGPMAMVEKGTPIIFFAPEAAYLPDLDAMIDKMISFGGEVHIITDNNRFDKRQNLYKLSMHGGEVFAIFNFALFAQLLSCRVSCKKGNNPDTPRALNKVTITK